MLQSIKIWFWICKNGFFFIKVTEQVGQSNTELSQFIMCLHHFQKSFQKQLFLTSFVPSFPVLEWLHFYATNMKRFSRTIKVKTCFRVSPGEPTTFNYYFVQSLVLYTFFRTEYLLPPWRNLILTIFVTYGQVNS